MAYTRRLRPERVTFFRLQVYERVRISLVEVYEKYKMIRNLSKVYESVGKSVILVCKKVQKG